MKVSRYTRFSIASVLMLMIIAALVGRLSLDRTHIARLNRELALHDEVERQRSVVEQLQVELGAITKQVQPQVDLQLLERSIGTTGTGSGQQIAGLEITPPAIGLRRQLTRVRNAELRLEREQAILDEQVRKLRSKVESRTPKV